MSAILIVIIVIGLGVLLIMAGPTKPVTEETEEIDNSHYPDLKTWPKEKNKVKDIGLNTYWGKENKLFPSAARIVVKHQNKSVELLQDKLQISEFEAEELMRSLEDSGIVKYTSEVRIPDERTLDDFFSRSESILDDFQEIERRKELPNLAFDLLEKFQEKYSDTQIQQIKSGEFTLGISEELFNDIIEYQYAVGKYNVKNKYSHRRETILKTKTKVIRKPARGDYYQNMQFQFDDGLLVKIVKIEN